jgi:RNA polymerase sigma factor (sigma-70 family)
VKRASKTKVVNQKASLPQLLNPLEQDVEWLIRVVNSSRIDAQTKTIAAQLRDNFKQFLAEDSHFTKVAEELGIARMCEALRDEEIADFVCYREDGDAEVRNIIWNGALKPYLDTGATLPECDLEDLLSWMSRVLKAAINAEYLRRRNGTEKPEGRRVRLAIVETCERGERIRELAHRLAGPLRLGETLLPALAFPQSTGAEAFSEEGKAEAQSIATEGIARQIEEFASPSGHIENPDYFKKAMDGSLNKAFWHARDFLATRVATELSRRELIEIEEGDAVKEYIAGDGQRNSILEDYRDPKNECEVIERKILVEQVLSAPELTHAERNVLFTIHVKGHTQAETAQALGISQSQVSKNKKEAVAKLREMFL